MIQQHREKINMSRQWLAGHMGVSRITIWRWETGKVTTPTWREDQARVVTDAYIKFLKTTKEASVKPSK
jgi:DNA-binding transcriptional regulator YiaG